MIIPKSFNREVVCIKSGNAFDGGNRVVAGRRYKIKEIHRKDESKINGEDCDFGYILDSPNTYPYIWNSTRFVRK